MTDAQITERASQGELIRAGFKAENVKQACYELSASTTYYDVDTPDRPQVVGPGQTILPKPKQILIFITEEELDLPADVLGRVLSKGQLFSLGILPVNTYADPGFCGRMGIVLVNASNHYLAIPPGTCIAKIEFVRLEASVVRPYNGQHGYQTRIWPIRHDMILTPAEVRSDVRIGNIATELGRAYGPEFGMLVQRIFIYQRRLMYFTAVYLTLLLGIIALAFAREDRLSVAVSVLLGIVSNIAFGIITLFATGLRRKS